MRRILIFIISVLVISLSYFVSSQTVGEFTVGNELPYVEPGSFAVQETDLTWDSVDFTTHEANTVLRWIISDPNPDSLTTTLCIGTNANPYAGGDCNVVNYQSAPVLPGTEQTYTYNTDPTGTLQGIPDTINFLGSDCSSQPCAKTYYVDIVVNDGQEEVVSSNYFVLTDYLTQFVNVYLSDSAIDNSASCTDFLPQHCLINPLSGDYTSVSVKLTVNDLEQDCSDLTHTAAVVLCMVDAAGAELCDLINNADYTYTLTFLGATGPSCDFSISVPVGDSAGIEFFKAPGAYKMYTKASSQAGTSSFGNYEWEYASLPAIDYSSNVYLGDRVIDGGDGIQLNQWNPGLSLAVMTNHGNRVLNLEWEATDPSSEGSTCDGHTTTCWDLTTTNDLQIDDDTIQGETTESGLNPLNIPETPLTIGFEHSGGLQLCDVMTCASGIDETLDTYFHISPPMGLSVGTYQTAFTITMNPI